MNWRSKRFWGKLILVLVGCGLIVVVGVVCVFAANLTKVMPDPGADYHWPYYLYVSGGVERRARDGEMLHLLVLPNNTMTTSDDMNRHERFAWLTALMGAGMFGDLDAVVLVPIFPRPDEDWRIYTHALDRDVLETDIEELHRLDLQLEAMIDDSIEQLSARGWRVNRKVLMWGFSASGMFVNRFTVLHPDRVLAASIGSPGGWPIAPLETWDGQCLRYPIGVCDLEALTGEPFDVESFRRVPLFFFVGDQDTNDSVPYADGYEDTDEALIFELFGETPVERWPIAERIYESVDADAEFHLYPGVGHRPLAFGDTVAFFSRVMEVE
jgi:hypothetical protein